MSGVKIDLSKPKSVHFIGIGGVSMSGLAEILMDRGFSVSGSDRAESELTKHLSDLGAKIMYPQAAENVIGRDIDLVVYTAAIHPDNPEYAECAARHLTMVTRADLLGAIMDEYPRAVAVAGTHGKTTTTSMLTGVLLEADSFDPTVTIGAVDPAIGSNVLVGKGDVFVAEACEYANSFLSFNPTVAVILNVEAEHLDFFKDLETVRKSFASFLGNVRPGGTVVMNAAIENYSDLLTELQDNVNALTFGSDESADCYPTDITFDGQGCAHFTPVYRGQPLPPVSLKVPGMHNIYNALAAVIASKALNVPDDAVSKGLSAFSGAKRRFEYRGKYKGAVVIDDYAHHPTEIEATLKAAEKVRHERLILVFQPHTYTRLRAFFDDFVRVLSSVDMIILAPVYAAREKDVYGIHSTDLCDSLKKKGCNAYTFDSFEEIKQFLAKNCMNGDLLITMGAGNIVDIADDLTAG